ncbi:MAG: DUF6567 family protein [Bacteroidia bacterium]
MKKIAYLLIVLLFTSCMSWHTGAISSGPLLSANDRYVDVAYGYASVNYFLVFGGFSKNALVYEAKKDMMKNNPLKKGEYYANYTVDFKRTVAFFIFMTNEVFVHADILSTNPDTTPQIIGTKNDKKVEINFAPLTYVKTNQGLFNLGEKIMYRNSNEKKSKFTPYVIASFINKEQVNLKDYNKTGDSITVNINQLIYSMDKERHGFRYGDSVSYLSTNIFSDKTLVGKIIATSAKRALVLEGERTLEIKYSELIKATKPK